MDYPLAASSWDEREVSAMRIVMESKRLQPGEQMHRFEEELRIHTGARHVVMVESGAMALQIAVAACMHWDSDIEPGDKIVLPAFTNAAVWSAAAGRNLEPSLIDCDQDWQPKGHPQASRDMPPNWMTDGAKIIIASAMLGFPPKMQDLQFDASQVGMSMIEDCTDSFDVASLGARLGTFGRFGVYDFGADKQLCAIKGGAVLCYDPDDADRVRMLRQGGRIGGIHEPKGFDNEYTYRMLGYDAWPSEVNAAIARVQLTKVEIGKRWRVENFENFRTMVAEFSNTGLHVPPANKYANPLGIHFVVRSSDVRQVLAAKFREAGIECRTPGAGSFRLQPIGLDHHEKLSPMADLIHHRGIMIGNAPFDITDKMQKAVEVIRSVL